MKHGIALGISLLVLTSGAVVRAAAPASGDLIFDDRKASPDFVAKDDCRDFPIAAGDRLVLQASADAFRVVRAADGRAVFEIRVPSEGEYVWQGQAPSRTTTEVLSEAKDLEASMDLSTTDITLAKLDAANGACVITRCPASGACE